MLPQHLKGQATFNLTKQNKTSTVKILIAHKSVRMNHQKRIYTHLTKDTFATINTPLNTNLSIEPLEHISPDPSVLDSSFMVL